MGLWPELWTWPESPEAAECWVTRPKEDSSESYRDPAPLVFGAQEGCSCRTLQGLRLLWYRGKISELKYIYFKMELF